MAVIGRPMPPEAPSTTTTGRMDSPCLWAAHPGGRAEFRSPAPPAQGGAPGGRTGSGEHQIHAGADADARIDRPAQAGARPHWTVPIGAPTGEAESTVSPARRAEVSSGSGGPVRTRLGRQRPD